MFAKYIDIAGGVANTNPKSIYEENGRVVDVEAMMSGKHILIDVRVTHANFSSFMQAALDTLGADNISEKEKIRKHGPAADEIGVLFFLFVVDTYGGFSNHASLLIKLVSSFVEDHLLLFKMESFSRKFIS